MTNDYHLLQPIQPELARFRFDATFQLRPIQWQAELITLQHYYDICVEEGIYTQAEKMELQQFIDIADTETEPRPIRIALAIPQVNQASLLKTIIMLRNYKRLQTGRHSYGDYFPFGG